MDLTTGQNLIKQKKFPAALKLFKNLLTLNPNKYDIYFYLGRVYSELQDFESGIKFYKKYLEKNKNSIGCILNLAILYLNIGDKKNSEINFRRLLGINRSYIYAYYGLFSLSENHLKEEDLNYLTNILNDNKISKRDRSLINFIFSKKEREKNNLKKELNFLQQYHTLSFENNATYNKQSLFYYERVLRNFHEKITFINSTNNVYQKAQPIFVIGLPRSGSTLIESLISTNEKKIKSYGESNFFNIAIFDQIRDKIFNKEYDADKTFFKIDLSLVKKSIHERYDLNSYKEEDIVFIDKSLENIFNIEVILKIFPNAKFIHTKRDIKDSILSIYFSMLPELSWTLSLKTIINYIGLYQNTISYYKKKFPERIFEVDLNELTSNSVKISQDVYKFCELNWNDQILNFYKRKDLFSKTISSSQIRKQISQTNQSKYDKYYFLLNKV